MGIQGLGTLISERAPQAVKESQLKNYHGRKIAIDASMSIYQFVIAMQGFDDGANIAMQNDKGEPTTHLVGLWNRALRMVDEGLKPVFVFDGTPPDLKKKELEKRRDRAAQAKIDMEKAKDEGDDEALETFAKRNVRLTKDHMNDCKKLLTLMGLPVVQAAAEAESQCVELVKKSKCWAIATEDMDALTFGAPTLLRHLGASDPKKRPMLEYHIEGILQQLGFTMAMFVDLCIMMGCDYCPRIPGIGPVKAFEAIQTHKSLEAFIETLDKTKYPLPDPYPYQEARRLFHFPDVVPAEEVEIQFKEPDVEALTAFLVTEACFAPERVEKGIIRLKEALQRKTQVRLDAFFTVKKAALPVHSSQVGKQAGQRRTNSTKDDKAAGANKPANAANNTNKGHKKAVIK